MKILRKTAQVSTFNDFAMPWWLYTQVASIWASKRLNDSCAVEMIAEQKRGRYFQFLIPSYLQFIFENFLHPSWNRQHKRNKTDFIEEFGASLSHGTELPRQISPGYLFCPHKFHIPMLECERKSREQKMDLELHFKLLLGGRLRQKVRCSWNWVLRREQTRHR